MEEMVENSSRDREENVPYVGIGYSVLALEYIFSCCWVASIHYLSLYQVPVRPPYPYPYPYPDPDPDADADADPDPYPDADADADADPDPVCSSKQFWNWTHDLLFQSHYLIQDLLYILS